jgi:hypothetical protein
MDFASLTFFEALADHMNNHLETFRGLGDADMIGSLIMRRAGGDFAVRICFEGLGCEGVAQVDSDEAFVADFALDGPIEAWKVMFDDIVEHGGASGRQTINSLALLGTDIRLRGNDPMGVDKFSRFNQTLQEYLDGASHIAVVAG